MRRRKYSRWKAGLVLILASLLVLTGFAIYDWWMERAANFIRYPEFGTSIPSGYNIHGIDVSRYQESIDWESVRDMQVGNVRIGFAFIKATEGLGNEDAYFARNWKRAKSAGLIRGAYHFFLATKSGRAQAENFINSVSLEPGDLPPVLDIEQVYGVPEDKLKERALEWLRAIQQYYGVMPIVYTNVDFYKHVLKDDFDGYPLWVAHYLQPRQPQIYRDWSFWQHSETGRVNGIRATVDFNVFNGDSTAFRKLLMN
jgi:lysozyme